MENVYYELIESEEGYVRDLEVIVEVRQEGMRKEDMRERRRVERKGGGRDAGGRDGEGGKKRKRGEWRERE